MEELYKENQKLRLEIKTLQDKLKTYTNGDRHKRYYEKNVDTIKQKAKEYQEKVKKENPEKIKEWRHNAYLKRKAKLELQKIDNSLT